MLIIGFGNKARQGKDTAAEAIRDHYERENRLKREHGILRGPGTQVGIFKYATALYQEVADFLEMYGLQRAFSGRVWLPINAPIKVPKDSNIIFNAADYEVGTKMIQIPEWVTMGDPTPSGGLTAPAPYGKHPKLLQWWGTEYRRNNFGENYWVDKMFASIPANLDIALVSDVRFPNEGDGVKQRGGYCVNVQRLREDGSQYFSSDRPVDHPSETALDGYNWDFKLVNSANHSALLAEQAITLAEYLRGLHK
jgi:hypothetical protein